jgi:hypothetical protein
LPGGSRETVDSAGYWCRRTGSVLASGHSSWRIYRKLRKFKPKESGR